MSVMKCLLKPDKFASSPRYRSKRRWLGRLPNSQTLTTARHADGPRPGELTRASCHFVLFSMRFQKCTHAALLHTPSYRQWQTYTQHIVVCYKLYHEWYTVYSWVYVNPSGHGIWPCLHLQVSHRHLAQAISILVMSSICMHLCHAYIYAQNRTIHGKYIW